jgi:hypothetical protein
MLGLVDRVSNDGALMLSATHWMARLDHVAELEIMNMVLSSLTSQCVVKSS